MSLAAEVPLLEAVKDVSAGNAKIPQSAFQATGPLAVVDQGQPLVAGYTSEVHAAVKATPPVIVFGDHTRAVKYVDFPFAMGADGVKVLAVKDGFDPRFVYHYLRSREIPSAGYSRHFKFLKEVHVPKPPLTEQRRIAAILDHADVLRTKRREVLAQLDSLIQSVYVAMFGGDQWPSTPLVELADSPDDIKCGPFGTQLNVSEFRSSGVPLLGIKNVNAKFDLPPFEFLDEATAARLSAYDLRPGDLVMTRKGTIGNCAIYPANLPAGVMHSDLLRARISPLAADVVYLEHHLQLSPRISHQIRMMSPGAVMPGINVTKLKQLAVDTPPIALQREFATRVGVIDRQSAVVRRAISADCALYASLQSRAFRGEL